MATWQFTTRIIPSSNINREDAWLGVKINNDSLSILDDALQKKESWSKNIVQYGNLEETCVELVKYKGSISDISMRIDLRTIDRDLVNKLLKFVMENDALLMLDDGSIIQPKIDEVIIAIKKSDAFAFTKDPESFLANL